MRKSVQLKFEKIVDAIVTSYKPERIILFGSYVWGNPNQNSDIDLFIIKKSKENRYKRHLRIRRLIRGILPVDILVYTPEEVEKRLKMRDFFIEDIIKKGKLIYGD